MTLSKMPFTDKNGRLTKAFQKEKHDTASQKKLESLLIKSLLEKLINSVLFGSGCRPACS